MRPTRALLVCAALAAVPALAEAQQAGAGGCELVRSGRSTIERLIGVSWHGGGTLFRCEGGVTIQADSAVLMEVQGVAEFIGRVRYADEARVLTADWAQFQQAQSMLTARGDIVLSDGASGTTIRKAPYLTYYQATSTRERDLIVIPSGRPEVVLVRAAPEGGSDTTRIDADALNIYGSDRFLARGNVVIRRADVVGRAEEAEYSEEVSELRLNGAAQLTGEDYELTGDTIVARTDEEDRLREVLANGSGELRSGESDMRATAPRITVALAEGEVERLIAVVPVELRGTAAEPADTRAAGEALPVRARAVSSEFTLEADSIEAVTPARQLERVTAIGGAFAERIDPDSARAELPAVIARDWVRGDTIVAVFTAAEPGEPEGERQIDRLTAVGAATPASALALIREDEEQGTGPGFSYKVARWIEIRFAGGEIDVLQAEDLQQGLYLQPADAVTGGTGRRGGSP